MNSFERYFTTRLRQSRNMLIPYYLMCCYSYYVEDNPLVSDQFYDILCRRLLEELHELKHLHKGFIKVDAVAAGTFLGEYPEIVEGSVENLREMFPKK